MPERVRGDSPPVLVRLCLVIMLVFATSTTAQARPHVAPTELYAGMLGERAATGQEATTVDKAEPPGTDPGDEETEDVAESVTRDPDEETGFVLDGEVLTERQVDVIQNETQTNENPDAQRRIERETQPPPAEDERFELDAYASVRLHIINAFLLESGTSNAKLGDGASRIGATAAWRWENGWDLFGRVESGFDVLDTFTTKGQTDGDSFFTPRLYNLSFETDNVYAKFGKSWSTYYKVAGAADRFSIFGGNAAGVYNAGTDGGATGTGRADNALQTEFYLDFERWFTIRPFNLNVQYQYGESIPQVKGVQYGNAWSFSAAQESRRGLGIGLAYHFAEVRDPMDPRLTAVGIDGDAEAISMSFKTAGDRWLAALVISRLNNIETTDQNIYFDGDGVELFAQWQLADHWWVVGGGNWLEPDNDERQAGFYEVRYGVLGLRYTFDALNRMLYAEWRIEEGTLADGTPGKDEFTVGVRWDFGY